MRFPVNEALLDALRRANGHDLFPAPQDGAVLLDAWFDGVAYLTSDGRVLTNQPASGEFDDSLKEADDDFAISVIVRAARQTGIEQLLDLIPRTPDSATVCASCNGSRSAPLEPVCRACSGRGWVQSA